MGDTMSNTIEQGVPVRSLGIDASEYPFTPDVARKRAEVAVSPNPTQQTEEDPLVSHPTMDKVEQAAVAFAGLIAGVGPGVASTVEVLRAAQNPLPAIVEQYIGTSDFTRPLIQIDVPATATPLGKEHLQVAELRLQTVPKAVLTPQEQANKQALFPDRNDPQFAGIFRLVVTANATYKDKQVVVVEPLTEKGSDANKQINALVGIISDINTLGGQADLVVGFAGGEAAAIVRSDVAITKGKVNHKACTYFFVGSDGKISYFEPSGRTGWRIKLFQVDQKFQTDLGNFQYNGQPLKANIGDWVLAEVDGTKADIAKIILLPGFPLYLFDSGDTTFPRATPMPGAANDLPTPQAPEAKMIKDVDIDGYTAIPQEELKKTGFTSGIEMKINDHPVRIETNIPNLKIEGIDKAIFEKNLQKLGISIYNENVIEIHDMKDYKPSMKPQTYETAGGNGKTLEILVKPERNADNTKIIHRIYISQDYLKNYDRRASNGRYILNSHLSITILASVLVSVTMNGSVYPRAGSAIDNNSYFMKTSFTPTP